MQKREKKNVRGLIGTRNGNSYCFVTLYVECLCYNNTASISLSPVGFYSYR